MSEETILIITDDLGGQGEQGGRGWGQRAQQYLAGVAEVPVSSLELNMSRFLTVVAGLFRQADQQVKSAADLRLDEIELQIELGAKGEVKLVAGGEASTRGAITLRFKRQQGNGK